MSPLSGETIDGRGVPKFYFFGVLEIFCQNNAHIPNNAKVFSGGLNIFSIFLFRQNYTHFFTLRQKSHLYLHISFIFYTFAFYLKNR